MDEIYQEPFSHRSVFQMTLQVEPFLLEVSFEMSFKSATVVSVQQFAEPQAVP
jgi:hypothetical protein